jgi:hypothetical protein
LLACLEATNDLILIGVDGFANKNTLGGELACECRDKRLEVEAAARKVKHMREGTTRQLQQSFSTVHVGRQLLQKAPAGIEVHRRSGLVGEGLDTVLAMRVVGCRCALGLAGGTQPSSLGADADAEEQIRWHLSIAAFEQERALIQAPLAGAHVCRQPPKAYAPTPGDAHSWALPLSLLAIGQAEPGLPPHAEGRVEIAWRSFPQEGQAQRQQDRHHAPPSPRPHTTATSTALFAFHREMTGTAAALYMALPPRQQPLFVIMATARWRHK